MRALLRRGLAPDVRSLFFPARAYHRVTDFTGVVPIMLNISSTRTNCVRVQADAW
jgi:hypothetical protein